MTKSRTTRGLALVAVLAFAAAACGDDDDTTSSTDAPATTEATESTDAPESTEATGTTEATESTDAPESTEATATTEATDGTEAPVESALGAPNPATGDEVKFMYVWSGVAPAVDNSADLASMRAIEQWVNEYGGGIGADHRKLVLDDCPTNSDAAVAAACGSAIVDGGYEAVIFNVVGEIEPWATPTLAAGIPIFNYTSADASLLGSPDLVYSLSNPVSGFGFFPAQLALDNDVAKTTIVVIDVPAASGPANALAPIAFEQLSAGEVHVLPISPTAPDHTTDIQAELQTFDPGIVSIIGNPAFCSLTIRALRDAGYEGIIGGISNCIDQAAIDQLGADLEGVYISYSAGEDPSNADYQTYLAIVDEYDPSIVPNGTPVGAWIAVEGFRRVMEDYTGDYTAATIAEHIRNHGPVPQPNIEGATFQCNSQALPILPIACTAAFTYSQLDASGKPTTFTGVG